MKLRVLSYNIHKGFTFTNRKFVLRGIRDSIRAIDADLVFLQEVLGHHKSKKSLIPDWPTQAQFEFIADEVWRHHAYGKNAVYASGHHGNAILSKYPIRGFENIDVSTNRIERRGLLHATIEIPKVGREVHVICLHLGLFEAARRRQTQGLVQRIRSVVPDGSPLIVAGDFNDWAENISPVLEKELGLSEAFMELHECHARTFPSWLPALKLDRVYLRELRATRAEVLTGPPWNNLSDHAALVVETRVE